MNDAPWSASAFMAATGSSPSPSKRLDQRIVLIEEASGGIIVFDRQLGAGKTVIAGRHIDQRYPDSRWRLVKIADLDFQRLIATSRLRSRATRTQTPSRSRSKSRLQCHVRDEPLARSGTRSEAISSDRRRSMACRSVFRDFQATPFIVRRNAGPSANSNRYDCLIRALAASNAATTNAFDIRAKRGLSLMTLENATCSICAGSRYSASLWPGFSVSFDSAFAFLAYVSNEKGNSISVIDTDKMETVATIKTGQRPRGIEVSHDGKFVFVAVGDDDKIQVFDTKTLGDAGELPSGPDPEQFTLDPSGKILYVANENDAMVTIIDMAKRTAIGRGIGRHRARRHGGQPGFQGSDMHVRDDEHGSFHRYHKPRNRRQLAGRFPSALLGLQVRRIGVVGDL